MLTTQKFFTGIGLAMILSGVLVEPSSSITAAAQAAPPAPNAEQATAPVESPVPVQTTAPAAAAPETKPVATAPASPAAPAQTPAATPPAAAKPIRKLDLGSPDRLVIPSIGFDNRIIRVGLNTKGEMDVPDGNTSNVGWYAAGTFPGAVGNAVIAAHVFAAFERLDELTPGSELWITTTTGEKLRFIVAETQVHKLSDMSADDLFNRKDARRLNLITCAGEVTADGSTYTHRRVVSAVLAP